MICLFGKAGSGKSTQGYNLAEKFGWRWISVGQVLRDSHRFDEILKVGGIVDSEETIRLVNAEIKKAEDEGFNVIFDQYPRSDRQVEWIGNELADKLDGVLILDVPKEELITRLNKRSRADDLDIETIEKRFAIFDEYVKKVLPLLAEKNIPVVKIDGTGSIEKVEERLTNEVYKMVPDVMIQKDDVNGGEIERSYGE